jgi:hypothetical protein
MTGYVATSKDLVPPLALGSGNSSLSSLQSLDRQHDQSWATNRDFPTHANRNHSNRTVVAPAELERDQFVDAATNSDQWTGDAFGSFGSLEGRTIDR